MEFNYLLQFLLNGLVVGAIYAMVGLGFALVYNTTHIFHIVYGVIYTAAAYLFYFFLQRHLGVLLSMALGLVGASLLGYLIEKTIYRPLHKKGFPLVLFIISSIGAMIVLINVIALIWGNETKILNPGMNKVFNIGEILITDMQMYQFMASAIVITLVMILLKRTKLGIILRAMRDDSDLTSGFGVDILRMRTYIFIISSFLVGLAGCLVAYDVGMDPYGGMNILLISVVALIIGGIGHFEGVIIGGMFLGIIQALVVSQIPTKWAESFVFIILIAFLLFRPQGIWGKKIREI
jgi:branched-chain amino acid transport system permease protein